MPRKMTSVDEAIEAAGRAAQVAFKLTSDSRTIRNIICWAGSMTTSDADRIVTALEEGGYTIVRKQKRLDKRRVR